MRLIACKPFTYSTRALVVGQDFEASSRDARVLVAIGKARKYVAPPVSDDEPDDEPVRVKRRGRAK